ncbi:MAG: hypothetical protein OER87_00885 [Gammaproteobacteria bacterium]|nr:hypothetical protein [Gammaproteobacteria bacterium]
MDKTNEIMATDNDDLLKGLVTLGCKVDRVDGAVLVSLPDDYGDFIFERLGNWLYVGATFLAPDEMEDSDHLGALDRFLLELQHRNLGCRFSYDDAGYLSIGAELNPKQQLPEEVFEIMDQISFICDVCFPMCEQILNDGEIPSNAEVDTAFGVSEKLH